MATVTVVSDTDEIYPMAHVRDANNIPYVLAVDASDNLVLYEGNAANPTSFSTTTVATAANWSKAPNNAYMILGVYSTVEYIWVFYKDAGSDLHAKRTPTSSISFTDQGDLDSGVIAGHISAHYDDTNERIVVGYTPDSKAMSIFVSTNGGGSWGSEIEIFDNGGTNYCRAGAVVWDGDYIHCVTAVASARDLQAKRYNYSTSTLEKWGGSSWDTCTDTDTGYAPGINKVGNRLHGLIGTNLMLFADGNYNLYDTGAAFSRSSTLGEAFITFANHGSDADMGNSGAAILITATGEVDDIVNVAGYNFSSSYEDAYIQTYDYSATSWSGMSQIEGYTGGYVRYFTGEKQKNGWAAFCFSRYDGSSNYYVYFRHYLTGTGTSSDGEDTIAASARIALRNEATVAASSRIALRSESTIAASSRLALRSEDIKAASARIALQASDVKNASVRIKVLAESIKNASTNIALPSEATIAASTRIALRNESTVSASTRIALRSESIKNASLNVEVKLPAEDVKNASVNIALQSEATIAASTNIALVNETTISASSNIALRNESTILASSRIKALSESIKNASTRIALRNEATIDASTRIALLGESVKSASTRIALRNESVKSASTRIAYASSDGESIKSASVRIKVLAESIKNASANIALRSESIKSASVRLGLQNESTVAASTHIALRSESIKNASLNVVIVSAIDAESIKNASVRILATNASIIAASTRIRRPLFYTQNDSMFSRNEKTYSQKAPFYKRL